MSSKPTAIILCDYWYPYISANSVCVQAILSALERIYNVIVIAADEPVENVASNVKFLSVGDIGINSALKRVKRSQFLTRFLKLSYKPIAVMNIFRFPIRSLRWAHRYAKKAASVFESNNVRLVLAVSYPAEAVLAAKFLKRRYPDVTAIGWFLDATAVGVLQKNAVCKKISSASAVRYETDAGKELDGMMYLTSASPLAKSIHGENNPKLAFADPPLLSRNTVRFTWNPREGKVISILYTGTLYNPDRNPTRFVEGMREYCQEGRVTISFAGNDGEILRDLATSVPNVHRLGVLALEECNKAIEDADILLSIGNRSPYLVPSKLFKYMSTGKPIIHLSRGQKDSCLPFLKKYPLALVLSEEHADIIAEFSAFIQKLEALSGTEIDLSGIYPAAFPNYTVELIQTLQEKHFHERTFK